MTLRAGKKQWREIRTEVAVFSSIYRTTDYGFSLSGLRGLMVVNDTSSFPRSSPLALIENCFSNLAETILEKGGGEKLGL